MANLTFLAGWAQLACRSASVGCGPIQNPDGGMDAYTNPVIIVEVLSASTANYDRGLKFVHYREIPSLTDYLVFHYDAIHMEHYTRQPNESWILRHDNGEDARIQLPSIHRELTLGSIRAGAMDLSG